MLIKLQDVSKTYQMGEQKFTALNDINLEINKGEFIAIMGPSGSGKSTLMNILGALDRPSTGKYWLEGKDVGKLSDNQLAEFRNRQIGFVFQQFYLLQRTSVYDNVALPGVYGGLDGLNQRVDEVLELVGLANKKHNKSNQLSGGQIQRVAVARALLMKPAIIMADEPTGNLDTKTSHEIMELIQQIQLQGNTIILITHEADIAKYAKRVISIKDGLIQSDIQQA